MNLIRYNTSSHSVPKFNPASLLDELDRLFETGFPAYRGTASFPVDIYRSNDSVTVRAELPGFRKEDLQVNVADDILTISGHLKTSDKKDVPEADTSIKRTVALPEGLDYGKIAASYENGVLTVTLPKRPETKPTTVAIEVK